MSSTEHPYPAVTFAGAWDSQPDVAAPSRELPAYMDAAYSPTLEEHPLCDDPNCPWCNDVAGYALQNAAREELA